MPQITGYHHVNLTVTDITRSTEWHTRVLGFTMVKQVERDGMVKVLLRHPATGIMFGFTGHGPRASGDQFSEFRTGMDHGLEAWKARFEEFGVEHSEIKPSAMGDMIAFRDSDNIQFEVYWERP
jgi:catechol 2,3-dioxygenase-like lactoylglutathione lyase family enzyme